MRDADVIVQKAFFHYRIFYVACSFQHLGAVSSGASSLDRVRNRKYVVPMWPADRTGDWRERDKTLRALAEP